MHLAKDIIIFGNGYNYYADPGFKNRSIGNIGVTM